MEKTSRGGSGLPVTAVTEKSRPVAGRIQKPKFEFKFLCMAIYIGYLLKFEIFTKIQKNRDFLPG
jgi:hypothetical protein